ncbi:MAG: SMP-30/gluconolactonase/LRE family protein [Caulobacteraceae bacterium]|nr:SMP-30/gluconolactonase/LRE family protein [Caulobacteraceae bacterium]
MKSIEASPAFEIQSRDITYIGHDLSRPECVLAQPDGALWISDNRGGVTRRTPDGAQTILGAIQGTPNGLAMEASGALLVAEIEHGGVHRLFADGRHEPILTSLSGERLGAVNFIHIDMKGAVWVTVSTRTLPRIEAINRPIADGYILKLESSGPRVVASGLCFPNELRIDELHQYAYLAESARGRIVRMRLLPDGGLGPPEAFGPAPLFEGAIVDGVAFDAAGGLWVTEVKRNGLYRITPDGRCQRLFEDPTGTILLFPASVAFGGPDLRTVFIGSILAKRLATFRSPIPGAPLSHWRRDQPPAA